MILLNDIFDKIYYVNLLADRNKNIFFQHQISNTILKDKCIRFDAVDGRKINIDNIDRSIITDNGRRQIIQKKQQTYGVSLTYGSLGCALSHKKIWEECITANKPFLILEDDIIPHKNFNTIFTNICHRLSSIDYDIFYIGYNEIPGFKKTKIDDVVSKAAGFITGTYGYICTPIAAKKLLTIFPLNKQVDSSISDNLNKFKVYCSTTKLVGASAAFGSKTQKNDSCINYVQIKDLEWDKLFK